MTAHDFWILTGLCADGDSLKASSDKPSKTGTSKLHLQNTMRHRRANTAAKAQELTLRLNSNSNSPVTGEVRSRTMIKNIIQVLYKWIQNSSFLGIPGQLHRKYFNWILNFEARMLVRWIVRCEGKMEVGGERKERACESDHLGCLKVQMFNCWGLQVGRLGYPRAQPTEWTIRNDPR